MKKKKIVAFTIFDKNNEKYATKFVKSLRKFHTEKELPLIIIDQKELDKMEDPMKFYRMTPMVASRLIKQFDTVLKFDCDQVVTGSLDHIINDTSYDLGCVLNSNPKELQVNIWNINSTMYMNAGFVAMRSEKLINHWWRLCNSMHFKDYQYKEQDLMNIIYHYGDYKTKCFDASKNWHGLISKGWWPYIELKGKDLILLKGDRPWPSEEDKTIKILHWAGGPVEKMKFGINFNPKVRERLEWLTT